MGEEEDCGGRGGRVPQRAKRPETEQFEECEERPAPGKGSQVFLQQQDDQATEIVSIIIKLSVPLIKLTLYK